MYLATTIRKLWNQLRRCPKKGHVPHPLAMGNLWHRIARDGEMHCVHCGTPVAVTR